MPDIVETLRGGTICEVEGMKCAVMDARSGCLCAESADEIERLRVTVMNLCVANGKMEDEIAHLREGQPQAQSRGGL